MANIFELEQQYLEEFNLLESMYEDSEGEITKDIEEQEKKLAISKDQLETKFLAYYYRRSKLIAYNKMLKERMEELKALADKNSKSIDRLEGVMGDAIKLFGTEFGKSGSKELIINGERFTGGFSSKIEVDDDFDIKQYIRKEFKLTLNTDEYDKLYKWFEANINVPVAVLHEATSKKTLNADIKAAISKKDDDKDKLKTDKARIVKTFKFKK
jgi:hypothetical protein